MNADAGDYLAQMVAAQKHGVPQGLAAICSANGYVLDTAAHLAARQGAAPLAVELIRQHQNYSQAQPVYSKEVLLKKLQAADGNS